MATLNTTLRNRLCDRLVSNLDRMEFLDSGGVTLVTFSITWENASVGNPGEAVVQNTPLSADGSSTGEAASVRFYQSGGQEAIEDLTVGATNADVNMAALNIEEGRSVELSVVAVDIPALFNA